jgi:hypothetical protein
MWPRAFYRAAQFLRYLNPAPLSGTAQAVVDSILPPPQAALFRRMSPGEQAHCLTVFRVVQQQPAPPELLQAALLHDVGKCRAPLSALDRVRVVLGYRFFSKRMMAWGAGEPRGWRKPFVVAAQHPAWGAELAEQAGASPLVVSLIRRHQERRFPIRSIEDELLLRLQSADNES